MIFSSVQNVYSKGVTDRDWSVGGIGGFSLGIQDFDAVTNCNSNTWLCGWFDGLEQFYGSITLIAIIERQFTPHWAWRVGVGLDVYAAEGDYCCGAPQILPAGEAYFVYHFRTNRKVFHPYALMGLRFPLANPTVGLGNEFFLNDKMSIMLEGLIGSVIIDGRIDMRTGLRYHF